MASDPANAEPTPKPREPKWRSLFRRSRSAVFVLGGNRRLRYANPAWEAATGVSPAKLRGTKISASRTPASPLWAALAPPPEVWRGESARVRRAPPGADCGPPWWDASYLPLRGSGDKILGVIGTLDIVGETPPRGAAKLPAIFETLRRRRGADFTFDLLVGDSPALVRLQSQLRWAAEKGAPTWIVAEAGTGKESLTRAAHTVGRERERRFVALDCRGLQPYLLEGLLFGKGGLASGRAVGTLHLKNPEKLPRDLQNRIAEWCGSAGGPHLVSASAAPVAEQVASGQLIPRFQMQLAMLEVRVPPLRERFAELPRFLMRIAPSPAAPGEEVLRILRSHPWPGNFHELAAAWHDALRRGGGAPVAPEHLPRYVREHFLIASSAQTPRKLPGLDAVLESVERRMIARALALSGGGQAEAAAKLGIVRARLARRIEALKLARPPEPNS